MSRGRRTGRGRVTANKAAFAGLSFLLAAAPLFAAAAEPTDAGGERVVARVLGQEITADRSGEITALIFRPLLERYADVRGIEVTDDQLETFLERMAEQRREQLAKLKEQRDSLKRKLDTTDMSERERKEQSSRLALIERILENLEREEAHAPDTQAAIDEAERESARRYIRQWKINQALFEEFGGRVIFQQAGPEPIDAYREFLEKHAAHGSFEIYDEALEKEFWRYFVNDRMHNFYPEGEGEKFMERPWWEMDAPAGKPE